MTLDADADQLRLRVSDTGVGIPESEAAQVFERFHRVNSTGGRTIEGTGIGLSLVAEAAAAMGGTVSVSSEVGSGSVFEVTLPRLVAGTEGATSSSADRAAIEALARELSPLPRDEPVPGAVSDPSQRDRPTILVVEDNPAMRSRIVRLLAELGDVVAAADGMAALDVLRTRRIDLVVTDVMMPRLDGLGLLREIRSDELLRGTPVVLLSARAGPEAAVGALEAGADDYVVKPFTAAELLARCRTTLELAQRRAYDATARARSALLAGVSHDMQTPLAVITSTLDLLSGDDLTPAARSHAAERATVRASQLTQLVTRFLDWSRLSMNEPLPIRISSCDLRETAVRVASEHERAEVGDGPGEAVVMCDPLRTEQILHNLVDNAEKVAVSSIAILLELAQDVVTARVVDDGAGVHPDVLPHLFEPFGPSAGTWQRAGTARLPRGGSRPGWRPVPGVHRARRIRLRPHRPPGSAVKVLLADDDEDIRTLTTHLLGRRGWTVVTASTGEAALATMVEQQFDVAVLDQNMPPGSGMEVAAARRAEGDTVPIVLWTGWAGTVDRDEAARLDVLVVNKAEAKQLVTIVAALAES